MADSIQGAEDPLALVLSATEAARPAQVMAGGEETRALAKVDAAIALLRSAILNHPRFVALEAAWRSLHRLVEQQAEAPVVVKLMPLTKREVIRDQRAAADPEDSDLAALIWDEGLGGGEPFGLLLADMDFGAEAEEVQALRGLAACGAGAFVPVVAHAAPALLDLPDWMALPGRRDIARVHEGARHIAWRALRDSEEARFLALAGPRVLARGGEGAPRWTGGGWVLASRIAAAFRREGWAAGIEGREDGTEPALPPVGAVPTECDPADGQEVALATLGLTLLIPRGADRAAVLLAPTLHKPPRFHASAATSDAALAARLPWVLGTGRFLHALALRARHELHRGRGAAAAARALNEWLAGFCGEGGPLAEASVELPEAKGHPGVHLLSARLRPRLPQGTPGAAHRVMLNLP
ncbi:type VI secretion system contractile sheath large subunit [Roseomonas eburnea]|uniref:Type VI secretion system contractile sheath large subunit n=1 Tax=Neoroseomonas eburnea TaxID=1346889 RepID=A0A9X9XCJ9_9PROT|nr:type VI secretion system contractile sheath large subunit [Neoroseomonas eburnea]MBR0681435.1 type VI secretion system contractile sheath large subunit [Neoroseomonas eburnea]